MSGVWLVDTIGAVGVLLCFVYAFTSGRQGVSPADERGETDADVLAQRTRAPGCVANGPRGWYIAAIGPTACGTGPIPLPHLPGVHQA